MESRKTIVGAVLIVLQAVALGFSANAINPHGIRIIRRPLSETHRMASHAEALRKEPAHAIVADTQPVTSPPVAAAESAPAAPVVAQQPASSPAAAKPKTTPIQTAATALTVPRKPAQAQSVPKPAQAPAPKRAEALFTTLADAKTLWENHGAIFVDARHKEDYEVEHISGALSLDREEMDKLYSSVLGDIPKDRKIVAYCSDPQCETAIKLADALVARGHTQVLILLEGLPGWKDAGYETTKGASP